MRTDLISVSDRVKTKGWKKVKVEFTGGPLVISVPPDCVELTMKKAELLKNPAQEIQKAIDQPCGGPTLEEVVRGKGKRLSGGYDSTLPPSAPGRREFLPPL
jgi:hypothetical protein